MKYLITGFIVAMLMGCGDSAPTTDEQVNAEDVDYQKTLQTQLLEAKPGDIITIPEGRFAFNRSLSLNVDGVTIRGAGMDKSILSFSDQLAGAEGMLVTANDFTIEDLAIEDAKGDALKINEGKNIIIRRVRTEWTRGPHTDNGAYGIYPVQTENTLIDGAIAIGASDAGIYVGQSKNVVVRNSRAEFNVAGIEIENTVDADVYDNVATNNTGGILVFNMPNLPQEGQRTRVFRNQVFENNTENFAKPGGAVAGVPAGSGVVINSNDRVEIFDNDLKNNQTANIVISSLFSTNYSSREAATDFDPYPESIYIHDNRYEGGGDSPDSLELKALKTAMFGITGRFPNVIWDGFANSEKMVDGELPTNLRICVFNERETEVLNVDGPNEYANPRIDKEQHSCQHSALHPVTLVLAD